MCSLYIITVYEGAYSNLFTSTEGYEFRITLWFKHLCPRSQATVCIMLTDQQLNHDLALCLRVCVLLHMLLCLCA